MSFIGESKLLEKVRKALEKYGYRDDMKAIAAEHIIDNPKIINSIINEILDEEVPVSAAVKHAIEKEEDNIYSIY